MIITFASNFLNHHQLPLCKELMKYCDEFHFIATNPLPEDRQSMGYEDVNTKYDFVVRAYDDSTDISEIEMLLEKSDVVIFGNVSLKYINYRMGFNKPTFLYAERIFKKGTWRRFIPKIRKNLNECFLQYQDKNLYILCASAFMSADLKLLGFNTDKCLKWGYFPQTRQQTCPTRENSVVRLLWAGRLIPFKHPEFPLKAIRRLKDEGLDFTVDYIGNGECEPKLRKKVNRLNLNDRVNFLGSMSPSDVLENMEKADVFLMTSDFGEGWGAVVNEAMSTGCAVLASSAAGSVPFLINDGENGLIYECGNQKDFTDKLRKLIKDEKLRNKLGKGAYSTIRNDYNAQVAARRLIEFVKNGCNQATVLESGPVSKVPVIKNKWYEA